MLFVSGKIVQFLIAPMHVVFVLLILAWFLRRRQPRWSHALLLGGIVLLYVASTSFVAHWMLRGLERIHPIEPIEDLERTEAMVLLGGTVYPIVPPRLEAEELSGARAQRAVKLFLAEKAPLIVCAGGTPYQHSPGQWRTEADDMRDMLIDLGIPENAIVQERQSRNTNENAIHTAGLLRERGIGRVLLVTSAFHMPRAVALFEREGIDVIPAPSDVRAVGDPWRWQNFFPSAEALKLTTYAINEYVGYWGYRAMGKL